MHLLRSLFTGLQILAVALAVPDQIQWTLHKSCYLNVDNTENSALEQFMLEAVAQAKSWAGNAASRIDNDPKGVIQKLITPLLPVGDFATVGAEASAKMKKIASLNDHPVGKDSPEGGRYDRSMEWFALKSSNDNHFNILLVCKPDIDYLRHPRNPKGPKLPYNAISKRFADQDTGALPMYNQAGKYLDIKDIPATEERAAAFTQKDQVGKTRPTVSEVIFFHPLYLKAKRAEQDKNGKGWPSVILNGPDGVSGKWGAKVFQDQSSGKMRDVRPIDSLIEYTFAATMLHELFHATAFGSLIDDPNGAYAWANCSKNKNLNNADTLAIMALIIALRYRTDGNPYTVTAQGSVVPLPPDA